MEETTGRNIAGKGVFSRMKGDKVVLIVLLLLVMISLIAISGSTSLLALNNHTTRMDLLGRHIKVCLGGLFVIFVCYIIPGTRWMEFLSKSGFLISVLLLAALLSHFRVSDSFKVENLNGACRTIRVGGFQVHVFEIVKVAMVMYLAWACKAYRNGTFKLSEKLASLNIFVGKEHDRKLFAFMETRKAQLVFYILLPIAVTMTMILPGSNSSAIFIGAIMVVTVLIGGVERKYIAGLALAGILILGCAYGIYKATDGKVFRRVGVALSRIGNDTTVDDLFTIKAEHGTSSEEYERAMIKVQQRYAAKIAVHEGGLTGKGIGGSTQKYVVPIMYGDFMYSYILEETGIAGGIVIIILYLSLLARGAVIVSNSGDEFARTAVAGLVLLISGQALLHILVNLDIGPLTGQTLPMISHGSCSFLCFSVAFGIILALSKTAGEKTLKEERQIDIERGRQVEDSISTDTGDF